MYFSQTRNLYRDVVVLVYFLYLECLHLLSQKIIHVCSQKKSFRLEENNSYGKIISNVVVVGIDTRINHMKLN
jgi:hypothetical protein